MKYDGKNPLHAAQAKARLDKLIKEGKVFELTEKKPIRSNDQNRYLHVVLSYFASETGNTLDWVKREYYKKLVNPDIFIRENEDKFMGRVKYLRSSAELDTSEMNLSIDRFRHWASVDAGIYIPSPEERDLVNLMEVEVERNKEYVI